jgi:hypothetical protein
MHAKDGATILVARGDGQELYKQDTGSEPWLNQFSAQGTKSERLTRNFRNTKINFLAAQCQFSYYPGGIEQLPELVGKLIASSKIGAQRDLGFDRDGGELTDLIPVPDDGIDYDDGHGQEQIMVERYRQLIGDEIEQLTKDDNASLFDLLVLVPHESSARAGWLRLAMARLATECGCDYVDLTREENRRASPTSNTIRLCTFHSSRGLEAQRVLIFGYEALDQVCGDHSDPAKLGFVILSRSLFSTKVLVPASVIPRSQSSNFLRAVRSAYFANTRSR